MLYAPGAAGEPAAAEHRNGLSLAEPDLPAEEQQRHVARAVAGLHAAEVEDALAFDEEVALLREEHAEAGEVDLLQILFHLGEVGPHRGVEDQPAGQPVLEVEAGVGIELVVQPAGGAGAGGRRHRVRLQLEIARPGRRLEPDHRRRRGHAAHALGPERRRDQREIRELVLPLHQPAQVESPGLRPVAAVAQRLERNRDFDRPAVLEAPGAHVPDAVPRRVLQVVGHRHVAQRAERVGLEEVAVAAIVEGVDDEGDVLVAEDVAVVAAQLVGHLALGMAVPAARRDVEVDVVEEDPGLGLLGGRLALARLLLDEVGERRDAGVDGVVETAVEVERGVQADGAHRDVVGRSAADQRFDGRLRLERPGARQDGRYHDHEIRMRAGQRRSAERRASSSTIVARSRGSRTSTHSGARVC